MAETLSSERELISVWAEVAFAPDPRAALAATGFELTPALDARLSVPEKRLELRAQLVERMGGAPTADVSFTVDSAPQIVPRTLPPGEFDMVVSLRTEILGEVLGGLYNAFVWPHRLPANDVPDVLLARLRALSDDIPDVDGLAMGALHVTAAPTVTAGPDGALRLSQPMRFEVDVVSPPQRTTVTSLTGALHYLVEPRADLVGTENRRLVLGLGAEQSEGFTVDADSPVRPRDEAALQAFSAFVGGLVAVVRSQLPPDFPVSPVLRLPFHDELPTRILGVRTTTTATESGAGAMHIGVMVGFGDEPEEPGEIPEAVALPADPFGLSSVRVVTTVHEATLQAAATASIPLVEDLANAKADSLPIPINEIVVDSVGLQVEFPGTIRSVVKAKVRDFCGVLVNTIDLDFTASADAVIQQVLDGTIVVAVDPAIDFDDSDMVLCAVTSVGDLLTPNIFDGVLTLGAVIVGPIAANSGALDPHVFDLNGVFEADRPVPLTELVVRAELLQAGVRQGGDRLELREAVTLRPDTEHLFVYVRVSQESELGGGGPFRPTFPVAGASVEVRDKDSPLPPGDDVRPFPSAPEVIAAGGVLTSVARRLELGANERMGRGLTGATGVERLVLSRSGGSSGTVVTTTTTGNLQTGATTTFETRGPGVEPLPDIYLRVRLPDGRRFDSVDLMGESGLWVNHEDRRLGAPDSPVRLVVPSAPLQDLEVGPV